MVIVTRNVRKPWKVKAVFHDDAMSNFFVPICMILPCFVVQRLHTALAASNLGKVACCGCYCLGLLLVPEFL
jgi:hypothetical protein